MLKRLIEHLVVWVAFVGFIYWTIAWAFTYAMMGDWGGTRNLNAFFILSIFGGYAAYGLLLSLQYLFFGRTRFLPWLSGKKPVREICVLLLLFSISVLLHIRYAIVRL
jgi:hypothetical protein